MQENASLAEATQGGLPEKVSVQPCTQDTNVKEEEKKRGLLAGET